MHGKLKIDIGQFLQHPKILAVTNTMIIYELNVKLYFMPIHPKVLCLTVAENIFMKDLYNLNRIKNWFCQILAAIQHLHNSGSCHLHIKTDNVLVNQEDNAILCDFSGCILQMFHKRVLSLLQFFGQKNVFQLKVR